MFCLRLICIVVRLFLKAKLKFVEFLLNFATKDKQILDLNLNFFVVF